MKKIMPFIIGLVLITGLLFYADLSEIIENIRNAHRGYFSIAILLNIISLIVRNERWRFLLNSVGVKVSFKNLFPHFLFGLGMGHITPAKVGEMIRCNTLSMKYGDVRFSQIIGTAIYERIFDLLIILLIMFMTLPELLNKLFEFPNLLLILKISILICLTLIVCALVFLFYGSLIKIVFNSNLNKYIPNIIKKYEMTIYNFYNINKKMKSYNIAYKVCISTIMRWLLEIGRLFFVIIAFNEYLPLHILGLIFSLTVLIGFSSLLPGGIGATEISMSTLLIFFGISSTLAISIVILDRIISYWLDILLSIFAGFKLGTDRDKIFKML